MGVVASAGIRIGVPMWSIRTEISASVARREADARPPVYFGFFFDSGMGLHGGNSPYQH